MGWEDQIDNEDEFTAFLKEILFTLEGAAEGITKQIIKRRVGSLSPDQKRVFDKYVMGEYFIEECGHCGQGIPWSEMYFAIDNGGLCNYCDNLVNDPMNE